jgi:hypothetical protein
VSVSSFGVAATDGVLAGDLAVVTLLDGTAAGVPAP